MKPIIEVKDLGKCYTINHKDRASYRTIKDDFARILKFKNPFSKSENNEEAFWALKDVNFEIPQGEIFGIVGENGSGKSTLLKILSRIVDPTEGSIKIKGRVSSLLEVGTGFHPELTGRENIFLNGSMLGMSRKEIQKKYEKIVEFSEIEKFIDTPVKFYSSGMYVRLAFSVAAHLDPDVLILDEVLAVGDASFQKKSLKKIQSTMRDGKTVIFVSHSMSSIRQLCTSGIMLEHGRIVASGKIDEVIEAYTIQNEKSATIRLQAETKPTWENDNNLFDDKFQPESVYIANTEGKIMTQPLSNGKDYELHIIGEIKVNDPLLNIGYGVWDDDGREMLYMSFTTDKAKTDWPKLKKGKCHLVASIQRNMLNVGSYKLKVIASIYGKEWILDPDSSQVKIAFQTRHADQQSPIWVENRGGLFAPIINWRVK